MRLRSCAILSLALLSTPVMAQDRAFDLAAPADLVESGFLKHLLPRFSLKHGVKITVVGPGDPSRAQLSTDLGVPVFARADVIWRLEGATDHPPVQRFLDWLKSDVGTRTITGFQPSEGQGFVPAAQEVTDEATLDLDGNAANGLRLSRALCERCHVVERDRPMRGAGNTPSFFALRSLADWEYRFTVFYVLNPHPSFTVIDGLDSGIAPEHRSAIAPLAMTLEEVDDVLAYVAQVPAADLGAPIEHQ